ncbi:MAG: Smr/MutS family protein [Thermoanaerobaculia bacterium]|jgi:DNA-nicking Smr family endonuclease
MDEHEPGDDETVEIPIGDTIDLHSFQPRDVRDVVLSFLEEARSRGIRQVRVIHGRGIGVQREIVRSLLAELPWVVDYLDADPGGGGWGATVVALSPPEE